MPNNQNEAHESDALNEPLLDAADVAGILGIPVSTVLLYARTGRLPSVRIGRHVRFLRSDIAAAVMDLRGQ